MTLLEHLNGELRHGERTYFVLASSGPGSGITGAPSLRRVSPADSGIHC